jgi:flagellar biosynthetic protein FlhB
MTGVLRMILPLALLVMAAGIGANLAAGGLVLSMHPVKFDAKRLNPISGLKRIADKQAMFRLVIATIKLAILASMVWVIVVPRVGTILSMVGADTEAIASAALGAIFQLGLVVTFLLGFIAAIDFVVQRRRALGQLKMTKDEVKRENKDSEGDPVIRGFRRRRAAQLAYGRMMDAVPTADVVVVNPVHLAIALRYDARTMKAPRIVAKGQRLMAERIKDVAREHNVPVIEDIPLARALFPRPIGSDVPPQFYRAVARLLVLVHQARRAASRAVADLRPEPQA